MNIDSIREKVEQEVLLAVKDVFEGQYAEIFKACFKEGGLSMMPAVENGKMCVSVYSEGWPTRESDYEKYTGSVEVLEEIEDWGGESLPTYYDELDIMSKFFKRLHDDCERLKSQCTGEVDGRKCR